MMDALPKYGLDITRAFFLAGEVPYPYMKSVNAVLFLSTNKEEVKESSAVVISYNAATKAVTIWVQGAGTATIAGQDFMKAVWSIWLGKIDQPSMGDSLISKL